MTVSSGVLVGCFEADWATDFSPESVLEDAVGDVLVEFEAYFDVSLEELGRGADWAPGGFASGEAAGCLDEDDAAGGSSEFLSRSRCSKNFEAIKQ